MIDKIIKICGIILSGAMLFGFMPLALHAYSTSVTTNNATYITPTSVTLNGSVSGSNLPPNASISAWFEYGTDISLGNSTLMNATSFYYGKNGNYNANVVGLSPNTTYYFRAIAQNPQTRVYGNISSFTTKLVGTGSPENNTNSPLLAMTEPASFVESRSVQLNSLVRNNTNYPVNTFFEWGTNSINLSNKTTVVQLGAFVAIRHADLLVGLSPGTTYYFHAVAESSSERNIGSILSFTTSIATSNTAAVKNSDSTTTNKETNTTSITQPLESAFGVNLGASALGSDSFLPVNVFGWLILIILILVLVLLGQHLYGKFAEKKQE